MRKYILALLFTIILPITALALDLDQAKKDGLVGERPDGYLGSVKESPSSDVTALIKDINNKRRAKYQEISRGNGQPLNVVEKLATKKVFESLESGEYFLDPAGNWQKK